jgi:hypothetical protein
MPETPGVRTGEEWLSETVRVTVLEISPERSSVLLERMELPGAVVLTMGSDGLLFNNVRVETEGYMAYVGLFDMITEQFGERVEIGSTAVFDADSGSFHPDGEFTYYILELDFKARMAAGSSDGDVPSTVAALRDLANAIEDPGTVAECADPITRVPGDNPASPEVARCH